jgi:hypothetical protein
MLHILVTMTYIIVNQGDYDFNITTPEVIIIYYFYTLSHISFYRKFGSL